MKNKEDKNELTLIGHLNELKHRICVCIGAMVLAFIFCYARIDSITNAFLQIGADAGFRMGVISPQELLIQSLRLCGVMALVLVIPLCALEVVLFLQPVLQTKKSIIVCLLVWASSLLLFALGMLFCFKVLFPFVFQYLHEYTVAFITDGSISVGAFLNFLLNICVIMALIFEVPLVTAGLSVVGIITPVQMLKAFKPVLVMILVIAAIVTPPDVISMIMVAIPMIAIYMVSIGVSYVCKRRAL